MSYQIVNKEHYVVLLTDEVAVCGVANIEVTGC